MRIRVEILIVLAIAALFLNGCVMKGAYDSKVQENQHLSENLDATKSLLEQLQEKHKKLVDTSVTQGDKLKAVLAESAELKQLNEQMTEMLKPGNLLETLGSFIAAQQQQIDALMAENANLKIGPRPDTAAVEPAAAEKIVPELAAAPAEPEQEEAPEADAVPADATVAATESEPGIDAVAAPAEAKASDAVAESAAEGKQGDAVPEPTSEAVGSASAVEEGESVVTAETPVETPAEEDVVAPESKADSGN